MKAIDPHLLKCSYAGLAAVCARFFNDSKRFREVAAISATAASKATVFA
jgi:hypothetical protein